MNNPGTCTVGLQELFCVCHTKAGVYKVPLIKGFYGVSITWLLLKTLCSRVLTTLNFIDLLCLLRFLCLPRSVNCVHRFESRLGQFLPRVRACIAWVKESVSMSVCLSICLSVICRQHKNYQMSRSSHLSDS
jgi:hypothetical protein